MFGRILSFYTKYFAVWVMIFAIVAYLFPGPFVAMKQVPYLMQVFFALTMFGIGAVLRIEDFKHIVTNPIIVIIGCCAQFTIMPLGAFVLSKAFALSPELAVGLILTGSAPGAMASNVMSYIAKADTAYSISLTTVSTLLCPVLTPLLTLKLAGSKLPVPFGEMVLTILLTVVLPLYAGFAIRHALKERIEKLLKIFPAISVTFIVFICCLVIASNKQLLPKVTGVVLAAVVILNIYGMAAGYGVGRIFGMQTNRRRALTIEIGMQNAGLGTVLAMTHFGAEAAVPAVLFVFVCILTASVLAELWQRET